VTGGRPPDFGGFAEVDRTGAAGAYAGYLDGVRGIEAVAEWKERSFALLDPRPGAHLLDVGCGTGDDVLALAARVRPGGRVTGIDASAAMIEEARRRAGPADDVTLIVGGAEDLPLPDAVMDGCRAERTLQHVGRPAAAAAEMVRVTRPGGRVVVAEPDWGTLVVDADDLEATRAVALAALERVRSGAVGRALRGMLVEAGLTEVGVAARTLVVTDRGAGETLLDLGGAAARAGERGLIAPERAEAWTAALEEAAARGRFLAALTAFMAWGRVPPAPRASPRGPAPA
jgi:SAM-dependent methyltransferase